MYCVNGASRSSLLESTDSMITNKNVFGKMICDVGLMIDSDAGGKKGIRTR